MHGAGQSDRAGVVGKGPHHMQMSGDRAQEVQSKITEGNQGIAKEPETFAHLDEGPLVVLPLLHGEQHQNVIFSHANTNITATERLVMQGCCITVSLLYSAAAAVSKMPCALWMKGCSLSSTLRSSDNISASSAGLG